eukprot:403371252
MCYQVYTSFNQLLQQNNFLGYVDLNELDELVTEVNPIRIVNQEQPDQLIFYHNLHQQVHDFQQQQSQLNQEYLDIQMQQQWAQEYEIYQEFMLVNEQEQQNYLIDLYYQQIEEINGQTMDCYEVDQNNQIESH